MKSSGNRFQVFFSLKETPKHAYALTTSNYGSTLEFLIREERLQNLHVVCAKLSNLLFLLEKECHSCPETLALSHLALKF